MDEWVSQGWLMKGIVMIDQSITVPWCTHTVPCAHTLSHVHTHCPMCTHTVPCAHTLSCVHTLSRVRTHCPVCTHTHIHTCTYTHTHTYTRTHICTTRLHTHTQLVHGELFLYMIASSTSDQEDWLALIRQRKCVHPLVCDV